MAWNYILGDIGDALGMDITPLMNKIAAEQWDFMSQDNPLIEAIQNFLDTGYAGKWYTVGDLYILDSFKKRFRSRESLGINLKQQRELLEKLFKIEDKKVSNRHLYSFDFINKPDLPQARRLEKKLPKKKKLRVKKLK